MAQDDMLKAAEAEVLRLEAEIAKTSLGQKLALARQVVTLYQGDHRRDDHPAVLRGEFTEINVNGSPTAAAARTELGVLIRNTLTKTASIEKVCADHLRAKRKRATSGELADVVMRSGIHLSGVTPSKSLAAVLSNSKLFDNIREEGGYGLVEWLERKQQQEFETATSAS